MAILESPRVQQLSQVVEESTRSTREGAKYFIEPALNTLARAKSKRHHIIFGRRGSGKSSLLSKVAIDLTSSRIPNAYIDLEKFKGHSYPDVLISVLIETIGEFKTWLETAAIEPGSRTSFWKRIIGAKPTRQSLDRNRAAELVNKLASAQDKLQTILHSADEMRRQVTSRDEESATLEAKAGVSAKSPVASLEASAASGNRSTISTEITDEYSSKKSKHFTATYFPTKTFLRDQPTFGRSIIPVAG